MTKEEFERFINKLEHEGGIEELLQYGGPQVFPLELRALAEDADAALTALEGRIGIYEEEFAYAK